MESHWRKDNFLVCYSELINQSFNKLINCCVRRNIFFDDFYEMEYILFTPTIRMSYGPRPLKKLRVELRKFMMEQYGSIFKEHWFDHWKRFVRGWATLWRKLADNHRYEHPSLILKVKWATLKVYAREKNSRNQGKYLKLLGINSIPRNSLCKTIDYEMSI